MTKAKSRSDVNERSYLYAPADRQDVLRTAHTRGADALIIDLEDAVAPAEKPAAREGLAAWLASRNSQGETPTPIWVRVNNDHDVAADLDCVGQLVDGIVVPKATAASVVKLSELNDDVALMALIETARGVRDADEIAASGLVTLLALGEVDLAADLGIPPDCPPSQLARETVVLASRANGLAGPVGSPVTELRDLEVVRAHALALRALGFASCAAIHPAQVETLNELFGPTEDEIAWARQVLTTATKHGGAEVDARGHFIDRAVLARAQNLLDRAGSRNGGDQAISDTDR